MTDKCAHAHECFLEAEEGEFPEGPTLLLCDRADYYPCTPLCCHLLREQAMADNLLRVAVFVYDYDRDPE